MLTENKAIYKSFMLLNGMQCDIIHITFGDVSRVMFEHQIHRAQQKGENCYDLAFFFAKNCCLYNGKKQDAAFIEALPSETYAQISVLMGELIDTNL